jgi:hypothetical protein
MPVCGQRGAGDSAGPTAQAAGGSPPTYKGGRLAGTETAMGGTTLSGPRVFMRYEARQIVDQIGRGRGN